MAKIESFRFWCQKVLPLVYDDSLSYYELLCKVVNYLNNTIQAVNENTQAMSDLQSYVENYFSSLDVQNEINNKLDSMAQDGSLSELISPYLDAFFTEAAGQIDAIEETVDDLQGEFAILNARVNELTNLPEGSTTGDAELADIRSAFNGFKFANAGVATRYGDANNDLKSGMFPWFLQELYVKNKYFEHVSAISYHDSTSSSILDYGIPVRAGKTYYFRNLYAYFCVVAYSDGTYDFLSEDASPVLQSGNFTAEHDGLIFITLQSNTSGELTSRNLAFVELGSSNLLKQGTTERLNGRFLDEKYIAKNSVPDECINSNVFSVQYVRESEFSDENFYYQIANGALLIPYGANAETKLMRKPVRLFAGTTYRYSGIYGYFCIFRGDDGTLARLTDSTSKHASGTFTPSANGYLFVTKSIAQDALEYKPMITNGVLPYFYTEGVYNIEKEIIVDKEGNGDYTKIVDAITEGNKYRNAKVYIREGVYDILEELGSDYVNNNTDGRGPELYNGIHLIFSPNAKVTCNYNGSREFMNATFSPFNINKGGATIEGLQIEAANVRYCVHDERTTNTDQYIVRYINCNMYIDNSQNPNWTSKQCIGGGLGTNGYITIDSCIFETVEASANNGVVSYHNSSAANARSSIIIKNSYFKGSNATARFGYYGSSDKITEVMLSGNSFSAEPVLRPETAGSEVVNMHLTQWNNEIREE